MKTNKSPSGCRPRSAGRQGLSAILANLVVSSTLALLLSAPNPAVAYLCEGLECVHSPDSTLEGKSHGEWSAAYWQWLLALPKDQNPEKDGSECLNGANGQTGPVWFLPQAGTTVVRHCTVPARRAVFFPVVAGECSTLEGPPFHGENETELRTCIKAIADQATALSCEFDGYPITNLNAYRVQSPMFEFTVPANNLLDVPAGTGFSVSDGYFVMLSRIELGQHTIHTHAEVPAFGFVQDITFHLTAVLGEPAIVTQPTNQAVYINTAASFSVSVTGAPPVTLQWRFNGTDLLNKTNTSLMFANVQFTNAGAYSVVIADFNGSITSQVAWLSVLPTDVVNLGDRELRFGQLSAPIWTAARMDDYSPEITGNGLTVFFSSTAPGGSGGHDIWMQTRPTQASAWSPPVNLGPTVNSAAEEYEPRLAFDGLSLYFDSNRPGGYGGYDVWVAKRNNSNDPFGPPVNLGPAVNSASDDSGVAISADNRTLVFNSLRPGGLGIDDVWMTTRTNASAPWEPARNLGAPINSTSGEFPVALSRDGLLLLIKSWRPISIPGADAKDAIYVCQRPSTTQPFGAPVLVRPILSIGTGGTDISSLSDDGATLCVGTYQTVFPWWPQVVQIGITPLPQLSAPRTTNGFPFPVLQFDLQGREGASYEIQVSTNLNTWAPWVITNMTGTLPISDPVRVGQGRRFYRVLGH